MEDIKTAKPKKKNSIKAGIFLAYFRLAVYLVVSVLYPPYLLQKVGESDNGLYTFAISIASLILLLSFGLENTYVHFATKSEGDNDENALEKTNGFYLCLFGFISLVMVAVGLILAFLYKDNCLPINGDQDLKNKLFWLIIIKTFSSSLDFFFSIFSWFSFYRSKFVWTQSTLLVLHVVTTCFSVLGLYLGFDIIGVAITSLVSQAIFDVFYFLYSFFGLKMRFKFTKSSEWKPYLKLVLKFSAWVFLVSAVNQINSSVGKTLLGSMVSPGKIVTIFSYGFQFYGYESLMSEGISNNFAPRVHSLAAENKPDELSNLWLKASKLQMVVLFCVVGGFAICGLDFISNWLRKSNLTAENFSQIYIIGLGYLLLWLIPMSQTVGVEAQRAYNKHKFLSVFNFICAIVGIGLAALFIYLLPEEAKVYGPLIGTAITTTAGMIIASNVFYKKNMKFPVGKFFKYFGFLAIITLVSWAIPFFLTKYLITLPNGLGGYLTTIIKALMFLVIYLPCVAILFRKEIKEEIDSMRTRAKLKKTNK